jgi:hypothetical protein
MRDLVLLGVVALVVFAAMVPFIRARKRLLAAYMERPCLGRAWSVTFPDASTKEIREYLHLFARAFGFASNDALRFAPTDSILDVYRASNPMGMPDALELETFDRLLRAHYGCSLPENPTHAVTLGEVFASARRGP